MDGRDVVGRQVTPGRRCGCGEYEDTAYGVDGRPRGRSAAAQGADRFVEDQLFEEDVRAVVAIMRPHRRERLMGWTEYRTGGANFRATVSWERSFERAPQTPAERRLRIPRLADVLESILVGSVRDVDGLTAAEEFGLYRDVVRELYRRLDAIESRCH
jgi:hypothetical protein